MSILSCPVPVRGSKPSSLFLMYVKLVVSSAENCTKLSRKFLLASSAIKKFSPHKRFTCHQALNRKFKILSDQLCCFQNQLIFGIFQIPILLPDYFFLLAFSVRYGRY